MDQKGNVTWITPERSLGRDWAHHQICPNQSTAQWQRMPPTYNSTDSNPYAHNIMCAEEPCSWLATRSLSERKGLKNGTFMSCPRSRWPSSHREFQPTTLSRTPVCGTEDDLVRRPDDPRPKYVSSSTASFLQAINPVPRASEKHQLERSGRPAIYFPGL